MVLLTRYLLTRNHAVHGHTWKYIFLIVSRGLIQILKLCILKASYEKLDRVLAVLLLVLKNTVSITELLLTFHLFIFQLKIIKYFAKNVVIPNVLDRTLK